jgi:thymidylate synthase
MVIYGKNVREAFLVAVDCLVNKNSAYEQPHKKKRIQIESASFKIQNPVETDCILGISSKNIPVLWSIDKAEKYFQELFLDEKGKLAYTYGNRLNSPVFPGKKGQLETIIDKIIARKEKGKLCGNNYQIIIIRPEDIYLDDRPCLQLIDFKIRPGNLDFELDMHLYWRSHDIFAFPQLISFGMLQRAIADMVDIQLGNMYNYESGLNVRGDMLDMLKKINRYMV